MRALTEYGYNLVAEANPLKQGLKQTMGFRR